MFCHSNYIQTTSKGMELRLATKCKQEPTKLCSSPEIQQTPYPSPSHSNMTRLTSQDILGVCKSLVPKENGYCCAGCCHSFQTTSALLVHVSNGRSEGFSCAAFYQKFKTFWYNDDKIKAPDTCTKKRRDRGKKTGGKRKRKLNT
ncbi:hypothetical protein GDO81_017854 [Engystomops pustulosus]|uniref:Uncharacterized protein n=1 Tax=Engystomops pustulosus TaxID=76066 RepID=A0AAV7AA60_ENGPU|nr:hypothetical protein GDO81_017854 [Engystomops pustulosus]